MDVDVSSVDIGLIDGDRTRELRRSVLRPHFDPDEPLPGDDRADAVHFGATAPDGDVLSTCVIFPEPCPWRDDRPSWQLRSMASAPAARGRGLAGEVLAAVVDYVSAHGGGIVWCNARDLAVPMYARGGFEVWGEPFAEHDIGHRHMWRAVS